MELKQAKEYFSMGVLTGFKAVRNPMAEQGWLLTMTGKDGRFWMLDTAKQEPRVFASLDTLVGLVAQIAGKAAGGHVSAVTITP